MGSALAVGFIAASAVIGIWVGLRPTHLDGRRISDELSRDGAEVECDRRIRLTAAGAEFACTYGGTELIRFRMTRDGAYAPTARP